MTTLGRTEEAVHVTVTDSVAELDLEEWDELTLGTDGPLPAHHLHVATPWLRRLEIFGDFDPQYVSVLRHGLLIGGTSTHRIDSDVNDSRIRIDHALADGSPDGDFLESILPCRTVGGLMDGRTGPGLRQGLTLHDRAVVFHRLFAAAERVAALKDEQSVACRSVDEGDVLLRSVLRSRGYIEFPGHQHLILRTPEGGFEGYLASFRKNRRDMVRREMRKLHDAGVSIAVEPLTKELAGSVLPLIANLNRRYGVTIDEDATRAELGMLRKFFKQDVHAVVARYCGQPVGYMDFIVYRNNAWAGQVGFDYEFQGTLPIYFGVLFYGIIEFASSTKLASIDYSFESEVAKKSRGCVSRPTLRLIRALDPANHGRLATLAASMNAKSTQ